MHQDNQPHDETALPDFEINMAALQRELEYELVETLDYVAYSRDTTPAHKGRFAQLNRSQGGMRILRIPGDGGTDQLQCLDGRA